MGSLIVGFVIPLLLFAASLLNRSIIGLADLLTSLLILSTGVEGSYCWKHVIVLWHVIMLSGAVIISHFLFHLSVAVEGYHWGVADAWWAKLLGFVRDRSQSPHVVIYFLLIHIIVGVVALTKMYMSRTSPDSLRQSCLLDLGLSSESQDASHFRFEVLCYLLLPAVQLLLGTSHPSWVSLPFFLCSCIGLVKWSMTSKFLGLFWCWRYLLFYAGVNIVLLYVYQLPLEFSNMFQQFADLTGLYKFSLKSDWPEVCSGFSLLLFYSMLSYVRRDLIEINEIFTTKQTGLTERLHPKTHSFLIHELRCNVMRTSILHSEAILWKFTINFFTYGFPVSLFALSFWSFQFTSLCSFGLLTYVGYVIYAFPSLFHLHRLNGLLLVFILLWAACTYIFNVIFRLLNKKLEKDMALWETIGLWHYSRPGLYLLAQFCPAIMLTMGNLVNSTVFSYLIDGDGQPKYRNLAAQEKEEKEVFVIATIAWGFRKGSRAIVLVLLFFIALRPGFVHAVYMIFFVVYLLSHTISRKLRQSLILLCEAHFAALFILQLNVISRVLKEKGSWAAEIFSQSGLLDSTSSMEFVTIAGLASFCAIQNHGFDILCSFSTIVQFTPLPPLGWRFWKAGLNKSVLLSVYALISRGVEYDNSLPERRTMLYLSAIGQKFLHSYRACGTYIVCLTVLLTVYLVRPNYISFGYLFFLLLWMNGRQLKEKTSRHCWFPLKIYAISVFILIYSLYVFISLERWLSSLTDLYHVFGYNPDASGLENIWVSLAVLVVMVLYSYERRRSRSLNLVDKEAEENVRFSFMRRLLIWHCEKILSLSLFYASVSPISAFGFVYLIGLIIFSTFPKSSRIPSKIFLAYSGFHLVMDYLFQMWGEKAKMLPGQTNFNLSVLLGLRLFEHSFFSLESGMRSKVLVIAACLLQYNIFHWLEKMPSIYGHHDKWEEPCALFNLMEERPITGPSYAKESESSAETSAFLRKHKGPMSNSWPSLGTSTGVLEENRHRNDSFRHIWGSSKDSFKWNKKWILLLRKERLEMQVTTLKMYLAYWMENIFNLFGLEINMIGLLLASFAVLNAISLLYVTSLAACILMTRHTIRKLWPIFVLSFGSVLILEYLTIWVGMVDSKLQFANVAKRPCHECWKNSALFFEHCKKCWLGIIVDDPRMLISYYMVFMLSCLKLRADYMSNPSGKHTYWQMIMQSRMAAAFSDLSFETKSMWTSLDYLRLYCYCHLLDLVLALILITGTLEYDILHLGYLGFALAFFRLRLRILKERNKIFKFLRIYNFSLIILSLAYQSPFVGDSNEGKCETTDYIHEVIGFYKYDYGFRITSRSALVEIIIFMLVSLQSHIFSSQEFDFVSKYLEVEKIDALVREQEKRASWKTAQLQHIRKSEEEKRLRNLQVENIKSEMLNLQINLHSLSTNASLSSTSLGIQGQQGRLNPSSYNLSSKLQNDEDNVKKNEQDSYSLIPFDRSSLKGLRSGSMRVDSVNASVGSSQEVSELNETSSYLFPRLEEDSTEYTRSKHNLLISAFHLAGDGVSHARSFGKKVVSNLVNFFNIEDELDLSDNSSENEVYYELESQNIGFEPVEQMHSFHSDSDKTVSDATCLQIGMIFRFMWAQMRANNDILCYCCFVLIFLWNFSLLSIVYLAALFLYALCVNTGPSYIFWVIMLIYSEICILLQYLYQVIIQHCGLSIDTSFLEELGFPDHRIQSSIVISNLPLFLVYLFTLIQTFISAREGKWASITEFGSLGQKKKNPKVCTTTPFWFEQVYKLILPLKDAMKKTFSSLCWYWKSVTKGAETPPYFVQLSMEVKVWPEDGIQPETIESGINKLLKAVIDMRSQDIRQNGPDMPSRVRIQSIERSTENPAVALAVFEVVLASSMEGSVPVKFYKPLTPAADIAKEILIAQRTGIFEEIRFPYPVLSVIGGGKRDIDLYAYVFCADLAVFFLVSIFYQSVIKNKSELLEVYQLEDQFPKEFVFVLMVIFFLIMLDRIIYLCSFATGKVISYLFSLVLFTYSTTKYAYGMQPSHQHAGKFAVRAIYLTKAISLALQAIQIHHGLPHKSTLYRQFLTSSVSKVNFLGFRLYRALPFLYELRCVLDWSCTTTSLTLYDWLKLEDIYSSLFLVKCNVDFHRVKHHQGQKQSKMTKFCNGICLFIVLICVIWAPMLMYSSGNPTNIANPIKDASIQIDIRTISGKLTLFETTLCRKLSWNDLDTLVDLDPLDLLSSYNEKDIQLICCEADASATWHVPPVVQARFIQSINYSMNIVFHWQFTRDRPKGKEVVNYDIHIQDADLPKPEEVMQVLNGTLNSFRIYNLYPRYFRVTGSGDVRFIEQTVNLVTGELELHRGYPEWWSFHDLDVSDRSGCGDLAGPMAVIVSEETPQGIIGDTLSKFSIWGLYITFVLAVGRFIRLQCSDLRMRIPFENLPYCDRLIAICEDIYAARAEGELEVEEVLYWTLVKIYRSPHMLLEYTKRD